MGLDGAGAGREGVQLAGRLVGERSLRAGVLGADRPPPCPLWTGVV